MTTTLHETKLNNGLTVLAKNTEYGISAITYANKTQIEKGAK